MIRVLFVCANARDRGPTAAQVFAERPGIATDFCGIGPDADDAPSAEQLEWADLILAMEPWHRTRLSERFPRLLRGRQIVVVGVPGKYSFMQPELVEILIEKAGPYLR